MCKLGSNQFLTGSEHQVGLVFNRSGPLHQTFLILTDQYQLLQRAHNYTAVEPRPSPWSHAFITHHHFMWHCNKGNTEKLERWKVVSPGQMFYPKNRILKQWFSTGALVCGSQALAWSAIVLIVSLMINAWINKTREEILNYDIKQHKTEPNCKIFFCIQVRVFNIQW